LGDQVIAAERPFIDDGGGLLLQALTLGGVEIHGGDDEDGGIAAGVGGAKTGEEFEAVDVGHHQIQDDDAGVDGGAFFQGFGAVGGLVYGPAETPELFPHVTAGVGTIVDDESGLGASAGRVAQNGSGKAIDIDGLGENFFGQKSARVAVVVENAQQDDGDAGEFGVGFQAAKDFPTVGAFHDDVERDHPWVKHTGHPHAFFAIPGNGDFNRVFIEEAADEAVDGGVVVNDEDGRLAGLAEKRRGEKPADGELFGDGEGEGGAGASLALNEGVAAQHAREAASDGETQAGSLSLAADGRGFELMKGFKEAREFFRADPGAAIDDVKTQERALAFNYPFDAQGDSAVLGEFGGVTQKIQQALADLDDIGEHIVHTGSEGDGESVAILGGGGTDEFDDFAEEFGNVKRSGVDFHFAGLDLRHFENRVDEFEEVLAGGLDLLQVLEIGDPAVGFGLLLQHLAVADDGVERRAKLMGHGSEKGALDLAGTFGGPAAGGDALVLNGE